MIKTAKKWIYKIRYILIILSALLGILGLSSSFGYELIDNCYKFTNGGLYNSCFVLSPGEEIYFNGYYNSVNSLINFDNGSGDLIWTYNNYNSNYNASWFWNNGELYFVQNSVPNWNYFRLWKNNYFCQINSLDNEEIMNICGVINFQGNNNYNRDNYNTELSTIIENFNGNNASEILFARYDTNLGNDINNVLCFKYNNLGSTFCIHSPGYVNETYGLSGNWFSLVEDNGISNGTSTLSKYGSLLELSPFSSSGGGGGGSNVNLSLNSTDLLRYFRERYGRTDSMCYVGTNTNAVWGDSVAFEFGSGATIFELYNSIYGSGSGTDYIVNVGTWINSWLLNYNYWFNGSNNCYNYYSGGQVVSDCSYTTFPFAGQKTAIYFMADLLNSRGVSDDGNLGYEFAVFCDNVFNGDNAAPVKEGSALQSNSSSYITYQNLYYGTSTIINSWGDLSSIFGTGNGYNDWNTNSGSVDLGTFFDKFNGFIDDFSSYFVNTSSNTKAILPGYIIVAFSLIILFGIIRK